MNKEQSEEHKELQQPIQFIISPREQLGIEISPDQFILTSMSKAQGPGKNSASLISY